eukprot:7153364-Prymnesium_polylepis.3
MAHLQCASRCGRRRWAAPAPIGPRRSPARHDVVARRRRERGRAGGPPWLRGAMIAIGAVVRCAPDPARAAAPAPRSAGTSARASASGRDDARRRSGEDEAAG